MTRVHITIPAEPRAPIHYVGCPEDEREQTMAAMRMLAFVIKSALVVVALIGLGLAMWWSR